jgi:hypothetical protein
VIERPAKSAYHFFYNQFPPDLRVFGFFDMHGRRLFVETQPRRLSMLRVRPSSAASHPTLVMDSFEQSAAGDVHGHLRGMEVKIHSTGAVHDLCV